MSTSSPYPTIGQMNEKIIIQQSTTVKEMGGQMVPTWVNYKTLFAKVVFAGGDEKEVEGSQMATATVKFTVRYPSASGVSRNMRIVFNDENYNIRSIEYIGRKRYINIKAELEK